ncbi:Ribonuclease BN [compost metagenome]|jgi:ribonuclease BN (tRNA processing enzyme)|uniref:Zinc phosphodiesterase n=2 Tax=Pandoraea TaxID=93217 RepID=A0A5E4YZY0_9BURK|nr:MULTISPECIES: MBL fold metallo-hydrolase [Pandoraea]VVE15593.1 zinc phosphodiesterase [Pandoraea cepalis]VVE53988.1 zinc phosphodiesterase [Pandoraea terrigena]
MCDCIGQALELGMSRRGFFKSGWKLAGAAGLPLLVGQPLNAAEVSNREAAVSASKVAAQQFDTRLVLLGTAGGPVWWPNCDREGISSALVVGDAVYVVDCGDGVGKRYKQAGLGQNNLVSGMSGMENLRGIFLTHLHSDHTVDYFNLFLFGWYNGLTGVKQPVHVYGPGPRGQLEPIFTPPGQPPRKEPALVNPENPTPGTVDMTNYLYQAFAVDINDRLRDAGRQDLRELIKVHDIKLPHIPGFKSPNETPEPEMAPFVIHEDDRVRVSATLVNHFPIWPAYAYRFDTDDGSVVFSGDTCPSKNLIRLAKDVDVLVHEVIDVAWVDALFPPPVTAKEEAFKNHLLSSHTSIDDVGKVAEAAGAKTLVLSHIAPGHAPKENLMRAQRNFSGQLIVGDDLMQIGVGRKRSKRKSG